MTLLTDALYREIRDAKTWRDAKFMARRWAKGNLKHWVAPGVDPETTIGYRFVDCGFCDLTSMIPAYGVTPHVDAVCPKCSRATNQSRVGDPKQVYCDALVVNKGGAVVARSNRSWGADPDQMTLDLNEDPDRSVETIRDAMVQEIVDAVTTVIRKWIPE